MQFYFFNALSRDFQNHFGIQENQRITWQFWKYVSLETINWKFLMLKLMRAQSYKLFKIYQKCTRVLRSDFVPIWEMSSIPKIPRDQSSAKELINFFRLSTTKTRNKNLLKEQNSNMH